MGKRRTRALNVRLLGERADGSEVLRDFASVSEAREALAEIVGELADWVIFELDRPDYAGVGRVLDCIDDGWDPSDSPSD